jgi:hypothetical protein
MDWHNANTLRGTFVEIYVVVIGIVPVEIQNYVMTNFAAFLAMLAALASKVEK